MNLIKIYLDLLQAKRKSPRTYQATEELIVRFNRYLIENNIGDLTAGDVSKIKEETLVSYHRNHISHLSRATVNNYSSILKGFFAFLYKNGHMPVDVSSTLSFDNGRYGEKPQEEESVRHYSHEDVTRIYQYLSSDPTETNLRTLALIALMLSSGLRISETCSLDVSSVAGMIKGNAQCLRKGGKWKKYTVGNYAIDHIKRYLRLREANGGSVEDDDPMFMTSQGTRLTRIRAWKNFAAIQRKLGILTGTHTMRRTSITEYAKKTGDPIETRLFADHLSFDTTALYVENDAASRKAIIDDTQLAAIFSGV
jgi:site-specific recombinase XerD